MSGEIGVKSGNDGEKLVSELLKLMGWNMAGNIQFNCTKGNAHKSKSAKGDRQTHNIDGLFAYENPLIHNNRDVAFISIKHKSKGYPTSKKTDINKDIKDLAQCLECADNSNLYENEYLESADRKDNFIGLLFFISSLDSEKEYDLISELQEQFTIPNNKFSTIYLIDNKKATFLISVLKTAKNYRPASKMEFLYHDTGYNNSPENLYVSSKIMPIELMNSSLIPIVLFEGKTSSLLLFTNIPFGKNYLKRLIWLTHKLCNLATEIIIFFPDYDATQHENIVSVTKNIFQDSDVVDRIEVKRFNTYSFVTLKEPQTKTFFHPVSQSDYLIQKNKEINTQISKNVKSNLDLLLPYGSRLKQLIATSQLSQTDLKKFLISKGIISKYAEKKYTVPILSSMLLNPLEIEVIQELLIEQEDKPKSINKSASWKDKNISLEKALGDFSLQVENINLPENSKFVIKPKAERKNENYYEVSFEIERINTTKDLITGATRHSASILITTSDKHDTVNIKSEYTSSETKKICDQISSFYNHFLLTNDFIDREATSIKFGDFNSNQERIDFLLSFKDVKFSEVFFDGSLENIKFKPDASLSDLPVDLEPMKDKVTNLDINGNNLDELTYVKEAIYKNVILLERVQVKFNFKFQENSGKCIATIHFPSTLNSHKKVDYTTILETKIEFPRTRRGMNILWKRNRLIKALSRELDDLVISKFIKASNISDSNNNNMVNENKK